MKLSTTFNPSTDPVTGGDELVALETAGLDCVWVAEAYGFDAVSTMGYLAARTQRLEIGSAIVNVFSRTPTLMAMTFAGLDSVSAGRVNWGSGPRVHK